MNKKILLPAFLFCFSTAALAQDANKAYAITSDGNADHVWMNIRQIDLATGQITKTIFQRGKTAFSLTDVSTKKSVDHLQQNPNIFNSKDYPTGSLVAAAAYDKRNHKLFYIPMRVGELRWADMNIKNETPRFYSLPSPELAFASSNPMKMDEADNITRMVIAADGNGYALSNDGRHFIQFTTGKKPVITELGSLIDDEKNGGISIHNKCSSWGGDMLADAFGKLYVISASRNVFVIDIERRVATYKGSISGLPANYTTNAAAVNSNGAIVLGSANVFDGYYVASLADLKASPLAASDKQFNASDFAGGNLLLQKEADAARKAGQYVPLMDNLFSNTDKLVFPNPVKDNRFSVLFKNQQPGNYTLIVSELSGRVLQSQVVNITKGTQMAAVQLKSVSSGIYMVTALNQNKQAVFAERVVVQ